MAITLRTASHDSATTKGDKLTHEELDANFTSLLDSGGSSLLGFIHSGTGASERSVQAKLRDVVHIKDFGAVCDGVTDDTAAVTAAIAALSNGGTLLYSGTPLITSTITVNKRIKIVADGALGINSSARPASYFIKDSSLSGPALLFSTSGVQAEGGGIVCEASNTGAGLVIRNNSCAARDFYVENAQTYGIHVDHASAGDNCNRWLLERCRVVDCDSHGIYIDSDSGGDANAGSAIQCHASGNGGDGIRSSYGKWNTFVGCTGETNTGWGINLANGADNSIIGGDFEANTAGQLQIQSTELRSTLVAKNNSNAITDSGFYTRRLDRAFKKHGTFTSAFRGASGSDVTATAVSISGSTATVTAAGHGYSNSDVVFHPSGMGNDNLHGAFVISNVSTDTYDFTIRTDASATVPTSATGLSVATRKCGAYTTNVCRYVIEDGECRFRIHLVSSAVTNVSGSVTIILPFTSLTLSNYFEAVTIGYMAGVTATNNVGIIIGSNSRTALVYEDIGGTPGTPSQLNATGLAAATTLVISGTFLVTQEN